MKYYQLHVDDQRYNDIVCRYEDDFGIEEDSMIMGKVFEGWDNRFKFIFDRNEGEIATDYLANYKLWFVVSEKLKRIMEDMNTDIQYFPVDVVEIQGKERLNYYVANVIKVVDALCLEKSDYFETKIPELEEVVYAISRYAVYEDKTQNADIFKLGGGEELMSIFVSERFKEAIEKNSITGIELMEIGVA